MPRSIFVVAAIVAAISIVIVAGAYFLKKTTFSQKNLPNIGNLKTGGQNTNQKDRTYLPVLLTAKGVREISAFYTFSTNIISITNTSNGLSIKTPIQEENIPNFVVTKDTSIVLNDGGKITPASQKDLKENRPIVVISDYNLKTKVWTTRRIHIPIRASLPGTPSATIQP